MYHCKRQPWNAGGPSEDTDSGGLSWPVQALEMESTSGVLTCENSAGVWGDMTDPSNDGHSPYLQPPHLQAPLHPDAQWLLSARRCSLLGSAPLVPRGGLHLPCEAPHLQPPEPHLPCGMVYSPWRALAGCPPGWWFRQVSLSTLPLCVTRSAPCPSPMPGPHSSARASVPLVPIPQRREGTSAVDWVHNKGGAGERDGSGHLNAHETTASPGTAWPRARPQLLSLGTLGCNSESQTLLLELPSELNAVRTQRSAPRNAILLCPTHTSRAMAADS